MEVGARGRAWAQSTRSNRYSYSDTQLAELFLHHRVLIVPIATAGRVHAVVTRHDFFTELVARFGEIAEER